MQTILPPICHPQLQRHLYCVAFAQAPPPSPPVQPAPSPLPRARSSMFGADLDADLLTVVLLDLGYGGLVEVGTQDWPGLTNGMVELWDGEA